MVQSQHPGIKYKSFSIYYDGNGDVDERSFISEVIKKYPTIDPFYKQPNDTEVESQFHHALLHSEVPSTGSSFISQYFLMKMIAENGIKVVLDGQGSDEYLGGYMHTFYRLIGNYIRQGKLKKALLTSSQLHKRLAIRFPGSLVHLSKSALCSVSNEQKLYNFEYRNYYPFILNEKPNDPPFLLVDKGGSLMDSFLYHLIFTSSLPSLLHYEDRNSMAFSIESRVPFLDHRLVEFAFTLNDNDKIKGIETKYILRKSLSQILPGAIANRQDKKGFVTPGENKWLKGPLKQLLEIDFANIDFLNKNLVKTLLTQYKNGDTSKANLIWRIATLNYWIKYLQ
jgi:asparagine synthase (glutamine-hydrolysing)